MGRLRRRATPPRSRRTQLGLIAVTAATLLMMVWAIFPSSAFPATRVRTGVEDGRLELKKETVPNGDPATFAFSGEFNVTLGDGGHAAHDVAPGTYSVSEAVPAGWTPSVSCTDSEIANSFGSGSTATFVVEPGELVTCVFTNTKIPPTTTTPPPTTTEPPTTTSEPPTVSPTTVTPPPPTTTQPPGGTAFTGLEDVAPLAAIALLLLTTGSGLMWAGSRRRRSE